MLLSSDVRGQLAENHRIANNVFACGLFSCHCLYLEPIGKCLVDARNFC